VILRLLCLPAGYGLYLGLFVFLVLAVSALARSSRAALLLLLGLWVVGTLIAPRAASELANSIYPTPSRLEFDNHLGHDMAAAASEAWSDKFGVSKQWDPSLPLNKWGAALKVDDEAGYVALDHNFGPLWDTFERQERAQRWIGFIAPVLAMRSFSMGLAGTDFVQHRDFSTAAEAQRRTIQDLISNDLIEHADPLGNAHFTYKAGPDLWASVPPFNYRPPLVSSAITHHWASLAILVIVFCAMAALAHFAFSRPLMR
jgi:ABC-2 type transport system permease protein